MIARSPAYVNDLCLFQFRNRAHAFAEGFLAKVKVCRTAAYIAAHVSTTDVVVSNGFSPSHCVIFCIVRLQKQLIGDPVTYEEFLRTLALSSAEQCSPVEVCSNVCCYLGVASKNLACSEERGLKVGLVRAFP